MFEIIVTSTDPRRPVSERRKICYIESFDAPDWQTALIAAAELAKIDDREIDSACDLGDQVRELIEPEREY